MYQRVTELLAPLPKSGTDKLEEWRDVLRIQRQPWVWVDAHYGRVHLGRRIESTGRDAANQARLSIELDADREEAHLPWPGQYALRDLLLHHEHQDLRPDRRLQEMTQHR